MTVTLEISGYDLSDEGPGRTFNEDATLVRPDLGLFAVADGAGGRGKGNVAAQLALRSIENYIGATVRRTHERPDYDVLGLPEQAKRLSAALHRAQQNLLEVIHQRQDRKGMATTVVACLFAQRTHELHIAHVGDSRLYRMRHGRLELLTEDHTIATDVLERMPELPSDAMARLPRNSVVRALGMSEDFRVSMRTIQPLAGDRYLMCSDGLTSAVSPEHIWHVMNEPGNCAAIASELLGHALAAQSKDNISVVVLDCDERLLDEALSTRRYNEIPVQPVSAPWGDIESMPGSGEFDGPEIAAPDIIAELEEWPEDEDDGPTHVRDPDGLSAAPEINDLTGLPHDEEPIPATQSSAGHLSRPLQGPGSLIDLESLEIEETWGDDPEEVK